VAEYSYLKPKVKIGNLGERKREHGLAVNISSYMKLGGFTSADKIPGREPELVIEKGPRAESGKPI
jgi:hypothetical protein